MSEIPLPQHPDIAHARGMTADDIDAVHELFAAAGRVDHPTFTIPREEIADVFTLPHIDPARDVILAFAADGALLASASSFLHPSRDEIAKAQLNGAVRPDMRRRGIGAAVLAWSTTRAREQLASVDAPVEKQMVLYAEERTVDAVRLAERFGLRPERWFTTMERDLSAPIPERTAPEGTELVTYRPELAEAARVARNDAFRDHWGSLATTPDSWRAFVAGPFLRSDLSSVVIEGERIIAFCLASVNEDDWTALGASHAYIDLIGVVRDRRGRGLAPTVIAHTLRAARDAGLERAVLDVDTASPTGALGLYERLGFVATERSCALVLRLEGAASAVR